MPPTPLRFRRKAAALAVASTLVALTFTASAATLTTAPVFAAPGDDPSPVAVGGGSYAQSPPKSLDREGHDVTAIVNKKLYIDGSLSGEPVPTNKWWSDLIVSKYSGDLWADPSVVSNSAAGTKISYPTQWNESGQAMVQDSAIQVQGTVPPKLGDSDIDMAGFEGSEYPDGWVATGDAFGTAPSKGTEPGQSGVSKFLGKGLVNSFTAEKGDGAMGTLTSPEFTVDRDFIALMVGGGNHPGRTDVQLVIDGETVESATGEDSEALRWVTWDVTAYAGQTATIVVVDDMPAGWAHVLVDQVVRTNEPEDIASRFGTAFTPVDAKALRWGDWNLSWRMAQSDTQFMDVTVARGTPYTWFEFSNVTPRIAVADGATFTAADGSALTFPATAESFTVTQNKRSFGVHAPAGSTFELVGNVIEATLGDDYLVVSALPASGASLADLHKTAFAIPRDSTMEYEYDVTAAEVVQEWNLDTEALQGTNLDTVQGWLPHTYNSTTTDIDFDNATYNTPRGVMKTSVGHGDWSITYPFTGITPVAPAPQSTGGANDYDPEAMADFIEGYSQRTGYGGDTYWGGKDVLQFAEYMTMAKQVGDETSYEALKASLKTALSDWFTYTPGESEHYFARYDTWKALIGFGDSYGSHEFTDNHFHYGYFTLAAGLLAFDDHEWAAEFGPMATLVAKQYANWDRDDKEFPYLRTFDVFEGHSYAGGYSSPGGNNQESSSEAIQSWAGLFLLGTALENTEMQSTGAMGYVTERAAVLDYYLDYNGNPAAQNGTGTGVFPDAYKHSTTGILFDSGQAFGTYFSAEPAWVFGIQWMPTGPWLNYLGWDRGFAKSLMADMFDERPASNGAFVKGDIGGQLGLAAKQLVGVGTSYGGIVTKNPVDAVNTIKSAVRTAYINNPGYATALVAANPLFNEATGELYFSVAADGELVFSDEFWTPDTLPEELTPVTPPRDKPDSDPKEWAQGWPLFVYLSTDYAPDAATQQKLHNYNVAGYTPGVDTKQAAAVYSRMGDALGNVVLGMAAQSDPEFYADVYTELAKTGDAVVTSDSMAGAVYYNAMANRSLGTEILTRHVANPTSQVYFNKDAKKSEQYSYAVYNPTAKQAGYAVYDGDTTIGTIQVPAKTLVQHHLDAALGRIEITAPGTAKTVERGTELQFTAVGYDQYGATIPIDDLDWSVDAGGSISNTGLFSATKDAEPVTVTARSGEISAEYELRVAPQPVLVGVAVSPAFTQVTDGATQKYTAAGRDQYGDPIDAGDIEWSTTAGATISAAGVLTASELGAGYVTATTAGSGADAVASGTAVATIIAAPVNLATGKPATASSFDGNNTVAAAVDGDATTRWESKHGTGSQWLQVDLGTSYDISGVQVRWENAAAAVYDIQVGDTAHGPFTTVKTVTKSTAAADDVQLAVTGRYLRILGTERLTQYGYSIWELGVTGTLSTESIDTSEVLIAPQNASVTSGRSQAFTAYAFDERGNGGEVDAQWTATGGEIADDGTYTAGAVEGRYPVSASFGEVTGSAAAVIRSNKKDDDEPTVPRELANVAFGKTVTASSVENAGTLAANAVDGSASTRWSSAAEDESWIQVDLGVATPIERIDLAWEGAYGSKYLVQTRTSADQPWTTLVTEDAGNGGVDSHEVSATARFVRVHGVERATQYGYSLFELSVWSRGGEVTAPNLAAAAGASATSTSDEAPGTVAKNAIDGNAESRWSSKHTDDEALTIDLGSAQKLSSVAIAWEGAYASKYLVQGSASADGEWTTLATENEGAGGTETHPVNGSFRFIRVQGVDRATPYGYSIFEVTIK